MGRGEFNIVFYEIDYNKKPIKPKLFIAKPNRTIIGKISEAYNIKQRIKLTSVNELEFDIPYDIDINHELVKNDNIEKIKERYCINIKLGHKTEWYIINKIEDRMEEDKVYRKIYAFSLPYELSDKFIKTLTLESKNAKDALNEVLSSTLWNIGYLDADFELTYRDFEFTSISVLDAIYQIAETFNALILWNTENRTLEFVKYESYGTNKGLKFSYGHYLKTLGKESIADEMVTRLKVFGKDGLSIEEVNPTGQNYIEDYSYFMYPFERDANKNTIRSSRYMSDSLCHAILDYNELIESKKNEFNNLLSQKQGLQSQLSQKETELNNLKVQEKLIMDRQIAQQFDNNMWFYKFNYNGTNWSQMTKLNPNYAYVALCKVSNASNIIVKQDGIVQNVVSGQWVVLEKVKFMNYTLIEVQGSGNSEVFIQIANITDDEYNTNFNEAELIEKYSLDNKQMQIAQKQIEIDLLKNQLTTVENNIKALRDILAIENNFTVNQLQELNAFVIEREFVDENFIDAKELYEEAQKRFEEMRKPQTVLNIDIVNFLEIVEEQHNWGKLNLGDEVIIKYEKIGVEATARIIEIEFDYENANINLTIANVKEIDDENKKLEKYIYKGIRTSTVVDLEKNKWTKTIYDTSEISQILERFWNKITHDVNIANNETVIIDNKGITIIDPHDPNRFLRATHGALALTRSGGLQYETAITPDGIIAERLFGKILLTNRVVIGDDDGIWTTTGAKTDIIDRCGREVMKIGLFQENPDKFGILLNRYESSDCSNTNLINRIRIDRDEGIIVERKDGSNWDKTLWLDLEGYANLRGVKIDYASGTLNNGILLSNEDGIVVTRSDNLYRTKLNATEGISIEKWDGSQWIKKFYVNVLDSRLWVEDLVAKRLRIVNDLDDILLDADTHYLNIGRFETIITDGKLTPIEKLTLKQEWETIQTEYQKLLYQAQQYEYSDRDSRTISHINIPPFTQAYVELGNYLAPLLADMSATTPVDRNEFKAKFQNYYDQAKRIINEITDALKYSSVLFGVEYNKVTIDSTNGILIEKIGGNVPVRTILNAVEGISIERFINGNWQKRFWVDTNGVIQGVGLNIVDTTITNLTGQLANNIFINPINGIVVNRSDGLVQVRINATEGLSIISGGIPKLYADINGVLKAIDLMAERLILKGSHGKILIDANQNLIDFNAFDMKLGTLTARDILAQVITSDLGFIANLTAARLKTIGKEAESGWSNYIQVVGNEAKWITGKANLSSGVQVLAPDGSPLYWKDAERSGVTTENTGMPVIRYEYEETIKALFTFEGTGIDSYPYIELGAGDGAVNTKFGSSAKGYIIKPNQSMDILYFGSNYAEERSIRLRDDGVYIRSQDNTISIDCKDFQVYSSNGVVRLELNNGSFIELSNSKLEANVQGDINLTATGNIRIQGRNIYLN